MTARTDVDETIPEFPPPRSAVCPFDPSPELRALAGRGPVTQVRSWGGSTPWAVTGHAEQKTLLADPRLSVDFAAPNFPSPIDPAHSHGGGTDLSFVGMDDPEHARLRRMISGAFTVKRVEAMRPAIQRLTDEFLDRMLAGPTPADLVQALALPLPSLVISEMLGVPYADHEFFQANSKIMVSATATGTERGAAHSALAGYLDELVAKKTAEPGDDLLSKLGAQIRVGELTAREAATMGVLLLLGGHETTANMISLGTLALLQHPDQLALLRDADDPRAVTGAVEELLRYLSIVHLGRRRTALEDIEVAGRTIPAGDGVILLGELANRDPEVFDDPDRLDLTRNARRHQAFGGGTHHCVGQPLARLELQVVYPALLRRVPTLRLAVPLDEVKFKYDAVIYGLHELPVTW
ncbi:cytochrome P450 [Amycolatopsis rubida]|uniref:Cytochrome P450 n=1 Tax=Amycolatopsis rubida TaxID=112413 RepID=A0A1I5HQQ8_9PSEU|nr:MULTISPECIES: cytochrome P450 [Amycolatopsis]MYW90848.1 cytochrome P450 [Amycolatopsis rubida]NEC55831.1 cytochrome P450 [Amycolatopsis rubida]OAP26091.1 Cytochrome P450-SU2 [Amycolatopsis sp. M39]SFO50469.1 Cytochrome P450 [Amycolatopsis rubida]